MKIKKKKKHPKTMRGRNIHLKALHQMKKNMSGTAKLVVAYAL